ncbi:MAG: HAD family hydrolase [Prochlorotrichaceae cyanobacterium]
MTTEIPEGRYRQVMLRQDAQTMNSPDLRGKLRDRVMTETMTEPSLFAFDFDGVLCDGVLEYFQVAWRTYSQIAPQMGIQETLDPLQPPSELFAPFAQGRAVIETGWEMPLLIHVLRQGRSLADIFDRWSEILAELKAATQMPAPSELAHRLDQVRDNWIAADLTDWLALHRFYPGVIECLQQLRQQGHSLAIVSTKEGRFIQQLLAQSQMAFPAEQIFGKEVKRSKKETLKTLMADYPQCQIFHFLEDRLAALAAVKGDPALQSVNLYLAGWGYNTERDRESARQDDRIQLLETIAELPV